MVRLIVNNNNVQKLSMFSRSEQLLIVYIDTSIGRVSMLATSMSLT